MTDFLATQPQLRRLLLWALPVAVLAAVVGLELLRGRSAADVPPPPPNQPPAPIQVAVLPAFTIAGGRDGLAAIGEHTLFNPTRKPAPPAVGGDDGPKRIPRGAWVLTGTQVFGDKAVAYLRSAKDGKAKTVRKGEDLGDGVLVAEVTTNSVRLTAGDESETLTMKVAAGPKTTVQPAVEAPPPAGGGAGAPAAAAAAGRPVPPAAANGAVQTGAPQSLAERRRAARAAQQGNNAATGTTNAGTTNAGTANGTTGGGQGFARRNRP
ncbi:MAG: hypothetical protein JSR18_14320 [Proteobacteria bacterium]|nr:hypothetical protein [Pseudomonadota bacterium]